MSESQLSDDPFRPQEIVVTAESIRWNTTYFFVTLNTQISPPVGIEENQKEALEEACKRVFRRHYGGVTQIRPFRDRQKYPLSRGERRRADKFFVKSEIGEKLHRLHAHMVVVVKSDGYATFDGRMFRDLVRAHGQTVAANIPTVQQWYVNVKRNTDFEVAAIRYINKTYMDRFLDGEISPRQVEEDIATASQVD